MGVQEWVGLPNSTLLPRSQKLEIFSFNAFKGKDARDAQNQMLARAFDSTGADHLSD